MKISNKESFYINELLKDYLVDYNIERVKNYIEDIFFNYERDIKLKLERLTFNSFNTKNIERLKKKDIPYRDLKSDLNLDIIVVEKEYKEQVLNFKNNEFGNFLFVERKLEENLLKEKGVYEFHNLAGKIDLNEKRFTKEELESLQNRIF